MVENTARRPDDDMRPRVQGAELPVDGLAAVDGYDPQAGVLREEVNLSRRLHGKLTGRDEHDCLRLALFGIEKLQNRKGERSGLSRSGLGLADHVLTGEENRNGARLNRSRRFEAGVADGLKESFGEAKLIEIGRGRFVERLLGSGFTSGFTRFRVQSAPSGLWFNAGRQSAPRSGFSWDFGHGKGPCVIPYLRHGTIFYIPKTPSSPDSSRLPSTP